MKITIKKNKFINKDVFVFPGYMFVSVNPQNFNLNKINSTFGVSKLLSYNNKPAEISHDIIITLKNRYEEDDDLSPKETLKEGDKIRFKSGPFVDIIATIEKEDEKNRLWLLLNTIGQLTTLKIEQKERINFTKV